MIVKNEEYFLGTCLESVKDLIEEIIIVDTGSTDKTKEICNEYGAIIYDFLWSESFSEARNFGINKATKEWILYLDADEEISTPLIFPGIDLFFPGIHLFIMKYSRQ